MNDVKKFQMKVNGRGTTGTVVVGDILRVTATFHDVVDSKTAYIYHNRYRVTVTNLKTGKRCSYFFHDSPHNTQTKNIHPEDLGYSILACIKTDWHYTKDNYPTFEDFANEFGYDTDSRKAEKVYHKCIRLGEKLQEVVPENLLEQLPD